MAEKQFNTRIINKHDIAANWAKATNFIPKKGELIVYDADTTNTQPRLKIGDGTTTVINLPFVTDITNIGEALAALDYNGASANGTATQFITQVTQADGLVSATKASIPTASGTTLGMVKQGGDVTISNGVITVNDDSHNHIISNVDGLQSALDAKATPANITSAIAALDYTSPETDGTALEFIATVSQTDGVVSATKAAIPVASSDTLGLVKSGTDITVDASGNVSVKNNSHTHTIANVTNLQSTLDAKATPAQITSAIAALDASDPTASGTATSFISTISQTDGVISATKASLPTAGTSLGMVKSGGDVTISSGTITVKDDSHNHVISNVDGLQSALDAKATPANITSAIAALDYTGATASGNATSFITQVTQTDGVVSATKASIPIATSSQAGLIKSGTDITVDSSGNVSVNNNSHSHTSANISDLSTTISTAITNAIGALDASDPAASGSATQFITSISQKDGVITATKANITAAALGLSGAMKFLGTSATAITDGATTNPITIGSTSTTVASGNVVLYGSKEFVWNGSAWEELGNEGSYKVQQSAVSSPAASGSTTAFIDTISQNAQGVITATKKTVASATQSAAGLMSAADKTKLDGIATGANNYSLPTASSSTLGGVKIGTGIGISNGVISNSGVRSVATGSTNGTISVNTNGSSTNVAVKGLGSAAYKNASGTWDIDISGDAASASSLHFIALESDADLNTVTTPGFYSAAATATAQAIANNPLSAASTGIIVKVYTVGGIQYQEVTGTIAGGIYKRRHNDGNWSNWIQVATVSDNVASATQLKNARTIDGVSFNGSAAITHYGECSTAAATAAKTVALTGFTLVTGARIAVKFTVTNTAANPTLNVNSTGAKAIMYRGSAISKGYLAANRVYEFVYDGTDWELIGDINTDTHYTTRLYAGASGAVANAAATSPYLTVTDNNTYRNQVRFVGSGATTVSSDANGNITISSTDNNTTYSAATQSAAGLMSAADKKKLDGIATGATANTGDITGVTAGNGLTGGGSSGSVTLNVGAGSGITVAADTVSVNTSYTTSGKNYKVAVDSSSGGLYVNVPWTDNNTWKANSSSSEGYVASGSGQANKVWKTDANGVPAWRTDANTTYSAATTSANGLMTSTMVTKLNGIATGATADTAITTAEINGVCV